MDSKKSLPSDLKITTTEMHTGGEPLRIIESGYPKPEGVTILDKRAWLRAHADDYRKLLMFEPRGHYDMYGALLVTPDLPEADIGVIFMHNEGYSTMCGHGVIALGRYLVDRGLVAAGNPEARVIIQCPCGPVTAHVTHSNGVTSDVRFTNVPSYVFALDVKVEVPGVGEVAVDISYGGAFYGFVPASRLGVDLKTDSVSKVTDLAFAVTQALKAKVKLHHPDSPDLAFIYGTIVTDGGDHTINSTDGTTTNICVFAEKEVDRSPCGSGVAARVALQYHRGVLPLGQKRQFRSGVTGSEFTARALKTVEVKGAGMEGKDVIAILPEVSGRAFYTGSNTFTVETEDPLVGGFLPR
ncbi:hypothetical protein V1264_018783 [Littorina saxatilis]|uniref:trans-L-3-hydroxyproline dehydratase n=2 Tax=Littorina saxatilis TaxID=31220 RepID=A0AAN9BFW4_9CAEN